VHAFEPTPEIAERLRQAKGLNGLGNLVVAETAVCDSSGTARLVRCDGDADNGGMNFIVEQTGGGESDLVATTTLDDYCRSNAIEHIDLLKIDVQGLECDVLRGASGLLSRGKIGHLLVELNWGDMGASASADDLIRLLDQHGFKFSEISASPAWRGPGPWLRRHTDIMASPGKDSACDL